MIQNIHFISGLPRSGSTLLSALLRQNPALRSDITGPMAPLIDAVHKRIGGIGEFSVLFDDIRRAQMLRGIFDAYYAYLIQPSVIFDTNRTWTGRAALLGVLYPNSKIICCVRDIGWIIDSLERMRLKNPLKLSKLFGYQANCSIYTRVDALMNPETGLIGGPWSTLREAWFSETAARLIVIPYDVLVQHPRYALGRLYELINEPYFEHDFGNAIYDAPEYDDDLGMPGLHTVRKIVEYKERVPVIPPDIFSKYDKTHFWKNADLNPRKVVVL